MAQVESRTAPACSGIRLAPAGRPIEDAPSPFNPQITINNRVHATLTNGFVRDGSALAPAFNKGKTSASAEFNRDLLPEQLRDTKR